MTKVPPDADLSTAVGTVNLEQALIDVEIANARVMDLTARLSEVTAELARTKQRLGRVSPPTQSTVSRGVRLVRRILGKVARKVAGLVRRLAA